MLGKQRFERAARGEFYPAREFNRLLSEVEMLSNISVQPPLKLTKAGGILTLTVDVEDTSIYVFEVTSLVTGNEGVVKAKHKNVLSGAVSGAEVPVKVHSRYEVGGVFWGTKPKQGTDADVDDVPVVWEEVRPNTPQRLQVTGAGVGKLYNDNHTLQATTVTFTQRRSHVVNTDTVVVKTKGGGSVSEDYEEIIEIPGGGLRHQLLSKPTDSGFATWDWVRAHDD